MIEDWEDIGIDALDTLTGGLPKGRAISLFGDHRYLEQKITSSFVNSNSGITLIITTRILPENLKKIYLDTSQIVFVDVISWRYERVNPSNKRRKEKFYVSNIADLNSLLSQITNACKEYEITRILFDTPSNILLYSTPSNEQVYRFLELLFTYTRAHSILVLTVLRKSIHDNIMLSTIKFLSDGVIEYRKREDIFEFRVPEMIGKDIDISWKEIKD